MENFKDLAIEMVGIYKYFESFCALQNINLKIKKGSIHALLGENGAGKSTLMNILYGLYRQDAGQIFINGSLVDIKKPKIAIEHKIGMVHQHFMLIPSLTVAQNIMLGSEFTKKFGLIDFKRANQEIKLLSEEYGLLIDTKEKVDNISVGMQQRVEILKALYRGAEVLILDEPTAILTPQEINELMKIMKNLTRNGKSIIIITHKLKEIKQVSDVCTIIRRGKNINTVSVNDYSETELATMMVGRRINLSVEKTPADPQEIVFEVKNLIVEDDKDIKKVDNISFDIKKGEILGVAGVDANGQQELIEAITCLRDVSSGQILMNGKPIQNTSTKNVINSKISTIPEDRHKSGLVMTFSVVENMLLKKYKEKPFSRYGKLNKVPMNTFTNEIITKFDIRPKNCNDMLVKSLSGGNQQKVIIGREISNDPNLLIAVQPTRGLDVGAIEYVHKELIRQRDEGKGILLVSLELSEVMKLSDRIVVIYNGKIIDTLNSKDTDENKIGILMAGGESFEEQM